MKGARRDVEIEPITIGPIVLESIAPLIDARGRALDCHPMVVESERHFRQIARAGGHSVTFHVEAADDPSRAVALARELGLGVGPAFNPETARLADDVFIQVDGGISLENVGVVHAAGAGLIVAGSSIFGAKDVAGAYAELASEVAPAQPLTRSV